MAAFKRLFTILVLALGVVAAAPAASAGDPVIEAAKARGAVGERIDGYLGVVGGASAAETRKVEEINALRRAAYARLAEETGATVEQVARVTGERQIDNAPSGQFVMRDSGGWQAKR